MKKSKFLEPYRPTGKATFNNIDKKSGIYLIKENNTIVYIGYSGTNLYKTMYRHFQQWKHRSQEVVTYAGKRHKYTVRVVLCTPAQAARLERALIVKHQPRDNKQKYDSLLFGTRDKKIVITYADTPEEKFWRESEEAPF